MKKTPIPENVQSRRIGKLSSFEIYENRIRETLQLENSVCECNIRFPYIPGCDAFNEIFLKLAGNYYGFVKNTFAKEKKHGSFSATMSFDLSSEKDYIFSRLRGFCGEQNSYSPREFTLICFGLSESEELRFVSAGKKAENLLKSMRKRG